MEDHAHETTIAWGKHLRLALRNGWEFVERHGAGGVVAVVAITDAGGLLLVEQFRVPLNARVIELPAGLAGDSEHCRGERLVDAARRELLEETGYSAAEFVELACTPTSPGLTGEVVTMYLARGLRRHGPARGDGSEQITLHEVPLIELDGWLDAARARGVMVDSKIYAGVHLAMRRDTDSVARRANNR